MERCRQAHDELLEFEATRRPGRLGREVDVATPEFDGGQEDNDGAAVDHQDTVTIELAPATTTAIDDVDGDLPPAAGNQPPAGSIANDDGHGRFDQE
uniref:DUF834 domain-containing protein n=1 Tax=Oryza meridionalis TaxID=40149 RepID=A0A0E0CSI7_9ORYZ